MSEVIFRSGVTVIKMGPGMVQIGTHPDRSVLLTGTTLQDEQWLQRISYSRKPISIAKLGHRRRQLIRQLREHNLLRSPAPNPVEQLRVRIVGLGRTGIALARTLRDSGVRYLDLRDRRPIGWDVEHLFPPSKAGLDRATTLQREMAEQKIFVAKQSRPDIVITENQWVVPHHQAGRLLSHDVPHLPIVVDDGGVQVGPLSWPGNTLCYLCVDLQRTEHLPNWPYLHQQLLSAPPVVVRPGAATAAAGTAALIVESFAEMLRPGTETNPPPTSSWVLGRSWHIGAGSTQTVRWEPHPNCLCRGFPRLPEAVPSTLVKRAGSLVPAA